MSQWTHVTGVVRIDGLPNFDDKYTSSKLAEFIGEAWNFDKLYKFGSKQLKDGLPYSNPLKTCNLPYGSEGSIDYKINIYGSGMPWATVTFWGDLRDYDSPKEIEKWAKELLDRLEQNDYYVRQYCFTICCDGELINVNA